MADPTVGDVFNQLSQQCGNFIRRGVALVQQLRCASFLERSRVLPLMIVRRGG